MRLKKKISPIKSYFGEKFKFLEKIDGSDFKIDGLLTHLNDNTRMLKSNLKESVNKFSIQLKNEALKYQKAIDTNLDDLSREINSNQNHKYISMIGFFYQYFYYFLLGICIFVLSLFILHSLGLAGMCSRRMHNNYKQTCHRGISANFFLAATSIYFIFGIFLIVLCIAMFLPGILIRDVCRPVLKLDDDQTFSLLQNQISDYVGNSSVSKIIYDCDSKNSSVLLNDRLQSFIDGRFESTVPKIIDELKKAVSQINIESITDSITKIKKLMEDLVANLSSKETNDFLIEIENLSFLNETLSLISFSLEEEVTSLLKTEIDNLANFANLLRDPLTKQTLSELIDLLSKVSEELKQESVRESLKNSIMDTVTSYTLPQVEKLRKNKTSEIVDALPPCKIVSNIYQSVTLSVCYEFTDNFNTFWLTLYILMLLFFVISCFSLSQADLFRKFYRYDELLDEEMNDEKDSGQYEMFRQKSGRANSGAIDAFEMKGYSQPNNLRYSNRSPPSRNTRA